MEIYLVTSFEKVLHYGVVMRVIRVYCIMVAILCINSIVPDCDHCGEKTKTGFLFLCKL